MPLVSENVWKVSTGDGPKSGYFYVRLGEGRGSA